MASMGDMVSSAAERRRSSTSSEAVSARLSCSSGCGAGAGNRRLGGRTDREYSCVYFSTLRGRVQRADDGSQRHEAAASRGTRRQQAEARGEGSKDTRRRQAETRDGGGQTHGEGLQN